MFISFRQFDCSWPTEATPRLVHLLGSGMTTLDCNPLSTMYLCFSVLVKNMFTAEQMYAKVNLGKKGRDQPVDLLVSFFLILVKLKIGIVDDMNNLIVPVRSILIERKLKGT